MRAGCDACRDVEVAVPADLGDGPAVAVLDPVGARIGEAAVVAAGDDHVADRCPVAVGQLDLVVPVEAPPRR